MEIIEFFTGPLSVRTLVTMLDTTTAMVVDPGGTPDDLLDYLRAKDIARLELVLTHAHFDHIGGLPALTQLYPNYALWVHTADKQYIGRNARSAHIRDFKAIGVERYVRAWPEDFPAATHYLEEGAVVHGFHVIHTPGHTAGSVCLWNKTEDILFAGDTVFRRSHGRTDLFGGSQEMLVESVKKLTVLPDTCVVYPGHGDTTTIGEERGPEGVFSYLGVI